MRIRTQLKAVGLCAISLALGLLALVTQPFVSPIVSQPPAVDPARLEAHVKHLSVDLYPRSYDRFRKLDSAAEYIAQSFRAAGAQVSVQDVVVQEATYKNIRARFGPPDGPLLVVGAHYDSHGDANAGARHAKGFSLETHTPGADDNASGTAGLLELAQLLGRQPQSKPIELVAYTLEEPPHFRTDDMGSVRHARALADQRREVRMMLSLEMIGHFSDSPGSQRYPLPGMSQLYSERGDFVALVGKLSDFGATRTIKALMAGASALPVHSINAPPLIPGIDFSDHASYWSEGFPALMVTDTAFFRNGNYHQAGDTYDKLDYKRMAQVVQSVYAITQNF